jgi:hypothetical protein
MINPVLSSSDFNDPNLTSRTSSANCFNMDAVWRSYSRFGWASTVNDPRWSLSLCKLLRRFTRAERLVRDNDQLEPDSKLWSRPKAGLHGSVSSPHRHLSKRPSDCNRTSSYEIWIGTTEMKDVCVFGINALSNMSDMSDFKIWFYSEKVPQHRSRQRARQIFLNLLLPSAFVHSWHQNEALGKKHGLSALLYKDSHIQTRSMTEDE